MPNRPFQPDTKYVDEKMITHKIRIMQTPPFRTYVRLPTARTEEEARARMKALAKLTAKYEPFSEDFLEFLQHPDEDIIWLIARNYRTHRIWGDHRGADLVDALRARAIADADAEGVIWTPVLDELATAGAFKKPMARQWLPRGHPDAKQEANEEKEEQYDRILGLIPWVAAQKDPKALHPLLEFRSDEVRKLLAREARVMDDVLFDRLRTSGKNVARAMAENKYMPLEYRTRLMNTCWETYRKARKGTKRHVYERVFVLTMLKAAITQGPGLPPSTRAAILAHLRRVWNPDPELVNIIVQDPEATRDDIRRILKFLSTRNAVDVILRERVHDSDMKALLKTLKVAEKVVEAPNPPPASLDWILHLHSNDEGLVTRIARHPAAPVSTLLSIAHRCMHQSYSLMTLAKRAEAREHPRIRSILVSVPSANVAESLLPYANSTEYPLLLNKIAGQSIKRALDLLESQPPPPNTRFPVELIQLLASAPDRELRIRAIALATQYNDGQSQTVTTERQHQATNV